MFLNIHPTSGLMTDEEIDAAHDAMLANEGRIFDEVMHGQPGPESAKWSVLPSTTRSLPWDWMSEAEQQHEVVRYALEE
jgi:hypothetical protein